MPRAALATFILRGLNVMNNNLILAGAIPAAVLALAFDFLLKKVEQGVTPRGLKKVPSRS